MGRPKVYNTKDDRAIGLVFPIIGREPERNWQDFYTFSRNPDLGKDEHWNCTMKRTGDWGPYENEVHLEVLFDWSWRGI